MREREEQQEQQEEQAQDASFQGGQLTALSVQKGNPDRLSLFVDDRFAFGVRREVAYRHGLKKGREVTEEELRMVWRDEQGYKARDLAAKYLGRRPRSQKEVADYLIGKEFDEQVVSAALTWLIEYGYLDDGEFARQWVENRMRFRPRGKMMLRWELKQKGIASSEIEEALEEEVDHDGEIAACLRLLRKKVGRRAEDPAFDLTYEESGKLAQFLMRKGFSASAVRESVQRFRTAPNLDND